MDVRDLQVFLSVAKHLNFTRAAEEVHLSQPSVSVRIRQSLKHIPPPNEKGPVHRGLGLQFYFTGLENVSSGSRLFPSFSVNRGSRFCRNSFLKSSLLQPECGA